MSLTNNYSRFKYSPDQIDEQEFLAKFVVRNHDFDEIFEDIQQTDFSVPSQHFIIIGQRGQGKTTMLRKIQLSVQADTELAKFLLPVKFTEEQYQIRSLSRLWEEIADYLQCLYPNEFPHILDDMEKLFDDADYEDKSFTYLENAINQQDKKILLLIDNIDELLGKLKEKEQRRLREILLSSASFKIVGGSTKMLEQQFDYGKPFYEFFKLVKLVGLTKQECFDFLACLGNEQQQQKIAQIIKNNPERIETLRRLTGGVPRTMVMLFDIFVDDGGDAFSDLLKILDDVTPLYKHRMDDLPDTLQDITHTIAMNWDGIATKDIAKKTRLESKVVSAQLKQLETKYGLVESVSIGKNKIYKIEERFFNIWYLMRFGRKKDRQKVEWLVNFLTSWCTPDELEQRALNFVDVITSNDESLEPAYVYHMNEALRYTGLQPLTEFKVKECAKNYLTNVNSDYASEVSSTDLEILKRARELSSENKHEEAVQLLVNSHKTTSSVLIMIGRNLVELKKFKEAEDYFSRAIRLDDSSALLNLGYLYQEQAKFKDAENCYLQAISKGNIAGLYPVASLYQLTGDITKAEEYFLKAINHSVKGARNSLALLYSNIGKNSEFALKCVEEEFFEEPNFVNQLNYTCILLWNEKVEESCKLFKGWLAIDYKIPEVDAYIKKGATVHFLCMLVSKNQLYKAKELMEMPEYNLKDKYKPIWYALMTLMQDEFPHEITKMGSELEESVNEVLQTIEEYKVKYSLS